MKLKVKVKRIDTTIELPEITKNGEWIDLRAAKEVVMKAPQAGTLKRHKVNSIEVSHRDVSFDSQLIPLGVAIQLPKGFEAVILPRSSTAKKFGIVMANSQGVIDNSYCGDNDEWKYPAIAIKDTVIPKGSRICQFRIQLSQKATIWQKLKWLFSNGIVVEEVNSLYNEDRGGFGSTGCN